MTERSLAETSPDKVESSLGPSAPFSTTKGKDDFNSVEEVKNFYGLPRAKEKKATGKSASCEFEAFKEGLYAPTALFHCFKTQGQRLPFYVRRISNH